MACCYLELESFLVVNMSQTHVDTVVLPEEFVEYINYCKSLIYEVRHYKRYREDFSQFDTAMRHPDKTDFIRFPLLLDIISSWGAIADIIKNKRQKPKPFIVSHKLHYQNCKRTLLEIKSKLKLYNPVKKWILQNIAVPCPITEQYLGKFVGSSRYHRVFPFSQIWRSRISTDRA